MVHCSLDVVLDLGCLFQLFLQDVNLCKPDSVRLFHRSFGCLDILRLHLLDDEDDYVIYFFYLVHSLLESVGVPLSL